MATATHAELLAAAKQALASSGVTDEEEAERFVAMYEAVSALTKPAQPELPASLVLTLTSKDPTMQSRIKGVHNDIVELARRDPRFGRCQHRSVIAGALSPTGGHL